MTHDQNIENLHEGSGNTSRESAPQKNAATNDNAEISSLSSPSALSESGANEPNTPSKTNYFTTAIFTVILLVVGFAFEYSISFSWKIQNPAELIIFLLFIGICLLGIYSRSLSDSKRTDENDKQLNNNKKLRQAYADLMSSPDSTLPQIKICTQHVEALDFEKKALERKDRKRQNMTYFIYSACILIISVSAMPIVGSVAYFVTQYKNMSEQSTSYEPMTATSDSSKETAASSPIITPVPDVCPPTFTPVPADIAQHYYDLLWNNYFTSFATMETFSTDQDLEYAKSVIETTWLSQNIISIPYWPIEEIEIYNQPETQNLYQKTTRMENQLRQENTDENLFLTGTTYVEATSEHIRSTQNNTTFNERDLGVACLRGVDLLMKYIRNQTGDSPNTGKAFYSAACLLQHSADYVYNETGNNAYILYAFSYACNDKALQFGYDSQTIANNKTVLIDSMENALQ